MAFGGQAINLLASICVAYPLARYKFPFRKFFYAIIIFRITIPVIGSGPASYKFMRALNFLDNPAPFMLTYFTGFDMMALILYGYFKGISKDYSEAAYIDGASTIRTFFTIILPQAMPCVLALYINQVMGAWNNFSTTQIYLHSYPNLAYGIYNRLNKKMDPQFFAAVFMSSLVPLTLFGAFQKTMLTNMSVGGLKG
jgi:oligogalacturonide transport system permease protein